VSSGGAFFVVLLAVVVMVLFFVWLFVRWQLEHGETLREQAALAEFGPLFQLEPSAEHVTQDRSAHRFRYRTDWDAVRREAGR
jgi:hypothetical protein